VKFLIVGAGEVGFHIARRLAMENKDVVIVDKDQEALRKVSDHTDVQTVQGWGSSPAVLESAGIKEAEIMLAVTDSDETNLVACLTADVISPTTKKLARVRNSEFDALHDIFRENAPHIDTIINPEVEVVKTIEQLITVSGATEVEDLAEGRLKLVGIRLENHSALVGQRLADLSLKTGGSNLLVAAIIRNEKMIVPRGDSRLMPNDLVYFISEKAGLAGALKSFGKPMRQVKRVLIVGGGRVGTRLAMRLENSDIKVKIIEADADRCSMLAEKTSKTIVLHGDGSDQELLSEENINEMDVVASLTNDEQTNILISLLAKRMGAAGTITKISKLNYIPLISTIGIEQVVSSRLSAINSILQHIRKGKVLSAISLKGEQAEVIEAVALETSELVGAPLRKVSMPKGSLVVGVLRGDEIIVPSGDTVIEKDDRVIIFAQRNTIPKIEKLLSVKLEFF